ncbi:hypothetical protein BH24CHL4_BH24CHL4_23850 [soil metagenome]
MLSNERMTPLSIADMKGIDNHHSPIIQDQAETCYNSYKGV